eukprot:scaffold211188_cov26-Prasinocladus_malaysianus.AAC.1
MVFWKKWYKQTEGPTERLLEYQHIVETQFDTDGQTLTKVAWETYMRMGRRVDRSINERMATESGFEKKWKDGQIHMTDKLFTEQTNRLNRHADRWKRGGRFEKKS